MNHQSANLLQVEGLSVVCDHGKSMANPAFDEVSPSIGEGGNHGLVGESGTGKTVLSGTVRSNSRELKSFSGTEFRTTCNKEIAAICLDPLPSPNPACLSDTLTKLLVDAHQDHHTTSTDENQRMDHERPHPPHYHHKVTVTQVFPMAQTELWEIAGHPAKISKKVPMLRWFCAPRHLRTGCKVAEQHTILGWPQTYNGQITKFRVGSLWAMSSHPIGWSPFPLPHSVNYAFTENERGSSLAITCYFSCGGLLALPFVSSLVKRFMRRSCEALLKHISGQADEMLNNHSIKLSAATFATNTS